MSLTPQIKEKPLESLDADQLRRRVLTLQYKYTTLQNEYEISKLSSERETYSLQNKYDKSMNELENALKDTKILYEENIKLKEELKSKDALPKEDEKIITTLRTQVVSLKNEVNLKEQRIVELAHKLSSKQNEVTNAIESMKLEIEGSGNILHQHETQINKHVEEIRYLQQELKEKENLISELRSVQTSASHRNNSTEELQDLAVLNKTLKEQLNYAKELEDMNLKQATELKKLRQNNDVQSLLKKENELLQSKLDQLNSLQKKFESLEMENISLQEKITQWGIVRLDGKFKNPNDVITELNMLQRENTFLLDTNSKLQIDFNQMSMLNDEMAIERNQLLDLNKDYETSILNLKRLNHELEQQKLLSFEECKLLRQQLEEFEEQDDKKKTPGDQVNASNIIEGYKNQTEDLTNELKRLNEELSKTDDKIQKRRKITNDLGISYSQRLNELILENKKLERLLSATKNHANILEQKILDLTSLKEKKVRILQLRDNPLLKEHYIRKEKLALLEKENSDLLSGIETDAIPRSVYDRIKHDMKLLEKEIFSANKKTTRLKEVFNKKSLEFIEAVNSLLGFKLEFLAHGKVKLVSCYQPNKYIIADLQSNTLKSDLDKVIPEWETLFQLYVIEKGELPAFLSQVKLRLWELSQP
ncbi:coiled-coil domain-containing protein MAD1 [Kluyveromyces lactis]|uniref:Spindle assembly checkpoint component MAD1 n=1 Tax=Kluyveromyces lactis (strain ATCC 8585 / CBS 2359 / DSM 70799 / NBRC 1267 / NRRL Y-1140 / WM37) TaxID=284590 RepID=MAD1_KLULA|nr:uncharacterized protein KLLA0_E19141g [Kluyveromyces lactis]Q6CMM2.1 RecName: Full=Spindle assembly checkpoint component MAD1; AltName: Full=Mitotic arrest deficient protein 1 [Kluyveromyces lactis NRRL Y-1140]CAG99904.1 KLLA0E19141p [Kluyveromyces lactis]|eukprot:XP_454817.1 uncharacterized protein KLLA0_E19141g [Kluyveromyces lactis]